jgi:hypothetical protein
MGYFQSGCCAPVYNRGHKRTNSAFDAALRLAFTTPDEKGTRMHTDNEKRSIVKSMP